MRSTKMIQKLWQCFDHFQIYDYDEWFQIENKSNCSDMQDDKYGEMTRKKWKSTIMYHK